MIHADASALLGGVTWAPDISILAIDSLIGETPSLGQGPLKIKEVIKND